MSPAERDLRFAWTSLERSEIPFRGGRCRFTVSLCETASDAVDAVILLRRIKIGNPVRFQIVEIQNVRIP
jgi:hypothetical protein